MIDKSAKTEGAGNVSTGYAAVSENKHGKRFGKTLSYNLYGVYVKQCRKMRLTSQQTGRIL